MMGSLLSIIGRGRKYAVLMAASVCFLISLSYIIHEMLDHPELLEKGDWAHTNITLFFYVLCVMAISGFIMMVVVSGILLNLSRVHTDTLRMHERLKNQVRAFESSRDGLAILDKNGVFTFMNNAHATCYGYENARLLIGKKWKILYRQEWQDRFEREIFPLLAKNGFWSGQCSGMRIDGTDFPQEVSLNLLDDGGLICAVRDLSETIQKDSLLKMIKVAVEAADDGIMITDMNNRILFMNQSFLTLHGYEAGERDKFLGADWRNFYNEAGQTQINSFILPSTILKGSWQETLKVMRKDGSTFYGDASLTRLHDGMVLGVLRDVSARLRAEKEREKLKDQLFQSQKMEAIARLTTGIAKDFESVLAQISEEVGHIRNDAGNVGNHVEEIHGAVAHARDLVDQLMSFTHRKNVQVGVIDVAHNIVEAQENIARKLPSHMECVTDIRVVDAYTYANPAQVSQILSNLCENATESMGSGWGKIALSLREPDWNVMGLHRHIMCEDVPDKTKAASIRVREMRGKKFLISGYLLKGRRYLQVSVADTGMGIAPEILPNIFDPFFTTKPIEKGTGLGLSTVHGAMVANNGAIIVESVPAEGTTIHLFFPRTDVLEYRPAGKLEFDLNGSHIGGAPN